MGFLEPFGATYANNFGFYQNNGYSLISGGNRIPCICLQDISNYVGINIINPSYMLDVSGVTSLRQGLILNNSYANNINQILFTNGTNSYLIQQIDKSSLNYFVMGRSGYSDFVINNLGYIWNK